MAIVHFAMKSSASAPPSVIHSDYIMRAGKYARMDNVYVESGNMPDFAQDEARQFWLAADAQERVNGRTYTELQIALPRELAPEGRVALAREAVREFLGERFAYTLAVHNPTAADKIEQPHMHLMFSERVVDEATRSLPYDRFFKRNGARKDRAWNDQNKAMELREQWCQMMNRALEGAGIDERVDHRSLADQGKVLDALLVEPKMLRRGTPDEKAARAEEIAQIRAAKAVLADLPIEAPTRVAVEDAQRASAEKLETAIEEIEQWAAAELSKLDKLVAAIKVAARRVVEAVLPTKPKPQTLEQSKLDGAVQWFEKHGLSGPLERYRRMPAMALSHANQYARRAPSEQDAATWRESGAVIRQHLQERR
jgi:hypothetical protein